MIFKDLNASPISAIFADRALVIDLPVRIRTNVVVPLEDMREIPQALFSRHIGIAARRRVMATNHKKLAARNPLQQTASRSVVASAALLTAQDGGESPDSSAR
jgi:hypothetical protein